MNFENNKYQLYIKDNAKEIYVYYNSNHPYIIKREIPHMIEKNLFSVSKTKDIFDRPKIPMRKL